MDALRPQGPREAVAIFRSEVVGSLPARGFARRSARRFLALARSDSVCPARNHEDHLGGPTGALVLRLPQRRTGGTCGPSRAATRGRARACG